MLQIHDKVTCTQHEVSVPVLPAFEQIARNWPRRVSAVPGVKLFQQAKGGQAQNLDLGSWKPLAGKWSREVTVVPVTRLVARAGNFQAQKPVPTLIAQAESGQAQKLVRRLVPRAESGRTQKPIRRLVARSEKGQAQKPVKRIVARAGRGRAQNLGPGSEFSGSDSPTVPEHVDVDNIVGLDVEFAVFMRRLDGGERETLQFAAEVCVVSHNSIYRAAFHPEAPPGAWFVGGVPPSKFRKNTRRAVLDNVRSLIEGKVVIGHSLAKDLQSLGLEHPKELCRDTVTYPRFRDNRGSPLSLKVLTKELLGRDIQTGKRGHNPEEDARAVLELYLRYLHGTPEAMSEEELVAYHLQQVLGYSQTEATTE